MKNKIWSDKATDYSKGTIITDRRTHEKKCRHPGRDLESCECPGAEFYTHEEAEKQPPETRANLVFMARKTGAWVNKT